jgi:hypothetical protein
MRCFGNIIGCFSSYSRVAFCNRLPRRSSESSPSMGLKAFKALEGGIGWFSFSVLHFFEK